MPSEVVKCWKAMGWLLATWNKLGRQLVLLLENFSQGILGPDFCVASPLKIESHAADNFTVNEREIFLIRHLG